MRLRVVWLASVLVLSACGSAGTTTATASATPSPAVPWLINVSGNPAPSTSAPLSLRPSSSPTWSSLPTAATCDIPWPTDERVLIPLIVTPGAGSLKVQWPSWYGPNYRVAAVNQNLVTGTQPPPTWIDVTAGTGCTVTATLTGLTPGNPYVVWLDAPNTPHRLDNSRSLYSGRSAVVRPL